MKAKLQFNDTTKRYVFKVTLDKKMYDVVIWVGDNGKFIDDEIEFNGEELDFEGTEGDIRERVINYLDENWDKLT